jgi:hypothetical protein
MTAVQRDQSAWVALGALVGVGMVAALTSTVTQRFIHPRDTEAFTSYVAEQAAGERPRTQARGRKDVAWAAAHPAQLVKEGDQACTWLARRPRVPRADETGHFTVTALVEQYLEETADKHAVRLSTHGQRVVVEGAWTHLCWRDRRTRIAAGGPEGD